MNQQLLADQQGAEGVLRDDERRQEFLFRLTAVMGKLPKALLAKVEAFIELARNHLNPRQLNDPDLEKLAIGLKARPLSKGWVTPEDFVEKILIYADDAEGCQVSFPTSTTPPA
ncbi:hypothetical protein PRN20_15690 [Devosia sp. ZB163]|uniref:hypothetical protein n=1 Tax=Devosia sp. ZB163 TaxID=3025938 RepID=UPI0023607637|nr:hypothetical protein [Devosia sp. ZB163]MDC9825172.1 hypothetical protein [Devosia sp. ZB163]